MQENGKMEGKTRTVAFHCVHFSTKGNDIMFWVLHFDVSRMASPVWSISGDEWGVEIPRLMRSIRRRFRREHSLVWKEGRTEGQARCFLFLYRPFIPHHTSLSV